MSDRSKLEKASWIAGILSAAIAVFLLFKPDGLKATQENAAHTTTTVVSNRGESSALDTPMATRADTFVTLPQCLPEIGSFSTALESAQKISSTMKRDGMYLDISRRALCSGDQEVYEYTVAKIYKTTIRDQAYKEGVDHYLGKKNNDLALNFAQKIYQTMVRDEALARIAARTTGQ